MHLLSGRLYEPWVAGRSWERGPSTQAALLVHGLWTELHVACPVESPSPKGALSGRTVYGTFYNGERKEFRRFDRFWPRHCNVDIRAAGAQKIYSWTWRRSWYNFWYDCCGIVFYIIGTWEKYEWWNRDPFRSGHWNDFFQFVDARKESRWRWNGFGSESCCSEIVQVVQWRVLIGYRPCWMKFKTFGAFSWFLRNSTISHFMRNGWSLQNVCYCFRI